MVGWHHQFKGRELGQTLGDGEGQGSLACCTPWGQEESDMTWWLNDQSEVYQKCLQDKASGGSWGFLKGLRKGCYLLRSYRPASEEKLIFLLEQGCLPLRVWLMHNTDVQCTLVGRQEAQMRSENSLCLNFSCLTYPVQRRELYFMPCGELKGKEAQNRGHICVCRSDSFCCTVET